MKIKPRRRLTKKTGVDEVARMNAKWHPTQKVNRQDIARAETYRNTDEKEETTTSTIAMVEGRCNEGWGSLPRK